MNYNVIFTARSQRDLRSIDRYLGPKYSVTNAAEYVQSIVRFCLELHTFPERGTAKPELGKGVRLTGYRGEVSILFRVRPEMKIVSILRIGYRGKTINL